MEPIRYDFAQGTLPGAQRGPGLLYISTACYGGDWHSTPHSHPCAELFYVLGGQGCFRIDNDVFPVEENDLVVVNPLVQHTESSLDESPLEYIVVGVEGLELFQDTGEERFCLVRLGSGSHEILSCLKQMLREVREQPPKFEVVCQSLLDIMLVQLLRRTQYVTTLPSGKAASRECATVRRYIDGHFKENLTLDQLAGVAHVNKYHMAHAFSREYGISPISYLNSRRIAESKTLLQTTDMSLSSISQALGFSSSSYFSQSFRRHEGISPQAYRQNSRKP